MENMTVIQLKNKKIIKALSLLGEFFEITNIIFNIAWYYNSSNYVGISKWRMSNAKCSVVCTSYEW